MQPLLIIDLSKGKGRPHGSQNKDHKYLLRFIDPATGEWVRVYPGDGDGHFNDAGQFVLNPGVSIADIINRELFGTVHLTDDGKLVTDKDGVPILEDGRFVRYAAIPEKEFQLEAIQAGKKKRPNKFKRDAIDVEKVGNYFICTYPKVPAIAWDKDGKPTRWAGFATSEDFAKKIHEVFHPSLTSKYGYKVPAKIAAFHVETAEHMALAHDAHVQNVIPAGSDAPKVKVEQTATAGTAVPKAGPGPMPFPEHHAPVIPTEHTEFWGPMKAEDPLALAKKLIERTGSPGVTHVDPLPSWVFDRYAPQELVDELHHRPITTLLSLGYYQTPLPADLAQRVSNEWTGRIKGMAGLGWEAHKNTKAAEDAAALDHMAGILPSSNKSALRYLRLQKTNDYAQEAHKMLLDLTQKWKPNHPNARFDKYVGLAIKRMIKRTSRNAALEGKTHTANLYETEVEAALRASSAHRTLSPSEFAELKAVAPGARGAIHQAMATLPETYRRVMDARLFLVEGEANDLVEQGKHSEHHADLEQAKYDAELADKLYTYKQRGTEVWQRNWTGPGGISDMYADWVDPVTGNHVDMTSMTQKQQIETLGKWYEAALTQVRDRLSMKGKLTGDGQRVKRYLELEAKLANASREMGSTEHKTIAMTLPGGTAAPLKPKTLDVVDFFSTPKTKHLARQLGLATETQSFHTQMGGSAHLPNISLGKHRDHLLSVATGYHARLKEMAAMSDGQVAAVEAKSNQIVKMMSMHHWDSLVSSANKYIAAKKSGDDTAASLAKIQYDLDRKTLTPYNDEAVTLIHNHVDAGVPVTSQTALRLINDKREQAQRELHMVKFTQAHGGLLKSFVSDDSADSLLKAFYDLDFALGRFQAVYA